MIMQHGYGVSGSWQSVFLGRRGLQWFILYKYSWTLSVAMLSLKMNEAFGVNAQSLQATPF